MTLKQELLASTATKTLYLFEKEKGGVGSTGSLVTAAHMLIQRDTPVQFIEASMSQLDVLNAYGGHHKVHELDLTAGDVADKLINIVADAPDGAAIFANIPGGRVEEIDEVHQVVGFALETGQVDMRAVIVWTMGLDAASSVTLDAMLDGAPPGPVWLNLPQWVGPPEKFVHVDDALRARIAAGGGLVFETPSMPNHLYERFRSDEIAIDRIAVDPDTTIGNRVVFRLWERKVVETLGSIF